MNITESNGESSCKGQENGDGSTGSERPLKKARFAWQVKGKYHLKNEISDTSTTPSSTPQPDRPGASNESNFNMGTEQNLEILGDYLLKQDFNTLDSVITDSDKSLLKPNTSISTEKLQYPRYASSMDNNVCSMSGSDSSWDQKSLPMSVVVSQDYTEDQCIARWQARQMAKGFVDNTINRVLDSWIHVPLPAEDDNSRFLALDVAEFINNLPGDNSIENEGILMAISAHGLQNTSSSCNNLSNEENIDSGSTGICNLSSPTRSLSPLHSDEENQELLNNDQKYDDEIADLDVSWSCDNDQRNDMSQFSLFPESSLSYQCFNENQNSSIECNENIANNHYDFLDAAVLFAIKNKGLTTFGTDYG